MAIIKKLVFLGIFGLFCYMNAKAQTVVIAEKPDTVKELESGLWGPNLPNYMSLVFGAGATLNSNLQAFNTFPGRYYEIGLFYKRKLIPAVALIGQLDFQRITNVYKKGNQIPEFDITSKQLWHNVNGSVGLSINLKPKRGNILGTSLNFFFVQSANYRVGAKQIVSITATDEVYITQYKGFKLNNRLKNGFKAELNFGVLGISYTYWPNPFRELYDEGKSFEFTNHAIGIKLYTAG